MGNVVAFFDMDHTVLTASSGMLYLRYLMRRGHVSAPVAVRSLWNSALYRLGALDYPAVMARLSSDSSGQSEADLQALCEQWFQDMVVHYISHRAVQRISQHREQGHRVAMISAATPYIVGVVARHVGCHDYLCTRLEVIDGKLTGGIAQPDCYGVNKVYWANHYLDENQARFENAYFYSDSRSDLPLLLAVGHPVAVNPDHHLQQVARSRGWPIEHFD